MNKKIILALLGLALGSCGGPAPSSSSHTTGLSTDSSPSESSSTPSSSDSGSASTSDSGAPSSDSGASSGDSGSGGGSSSDSGSSSSSSGGESSGSDSGSGSSQQDPSEAKKEKIVTFLTADDGGFNGGVFTVKTSIQSPLQISYGQYLQNILQSQEMTATYQSVGKKAASELVSGGAFLVEVGNAVVAYQELKTAMGSDLPPAPDGVDVTTEDGTVAYFKFFLETMYSSMSGQQVECRHKTENGFNVYTIEGSETLSDATYIDEKTDKLDFYRYDSYYKVNRHGSAPLHTEDLHGIYRSPLGGNFMGYARTHLEKIEAAIVEDAASGVFTIKFSQLAKDPDAAEVNVFGNSPLSYVPDLTVSFDASGSISGFAGSMEQAKTKVEVRATLAKTGGSVTIPTDVTECDHPYPFERKFETEDGVGGHCHYCSNCHSVFDYGRHEYHQGDDHCHVCGYVATKEAAIKQGVTLPAPLADLKILEAKESGNFIRLDGLEGFSKGVNGDPAEKDLVVDFETQVKDETNAYRVYAQGTQKDQEYPGCMVPMDFVVSYTLLDGEEHDPVVIYEKSCYWEYHHTEPKKIEGMGDSCHVYSIEECSVCGHEYGYPVLKVNHVINQQKNQDGTVTISCANCHESAVLRVGKIEAEEQYHYVTYEHVSGNRELYEFFVENNSWGMHQYQDGVCVVCGHESSERQVEVDLSSLIGEGATMTLSVNKDHESTSIPQSEYAYPIPMAAYDESTCEYIRGYFLSGHPQYIVQYEPFYKQVGTCEFEVSWKIAVYPVKTVEGSYYIDGDAIDSYPDPWSPTPKTIHKETHHEYLRQGDSCLYTVKDVCDVCGETVHEDERHFHQIAVAKEGDNFRLTCENCHENALVKEYFCNPANDDYHCWAATGLSEASDPEFGKELQGAAMYGFHSYDEEGRCVCGDFHEEKMTNYVWANKLNTGAPFDVAGGIHIVRDQSGRATSAELYGQGDPISSTDTQWNYKAVNSEGVEVGLIQERKNYVPYEDGLVLSEHQFSLSLTGIGNDVSQWCLTDYDAQTPDYKSFRILIACELHGEEEDVAGRINFQYLEEDGSKMLNGISYEGVGAAIPSLAKIENLEEGQRIDVKVFQIVDSEGNPLNYCFISKEYQHLEGEEWVEHETHYCIASFDPAEPASDIDDMYLVEVASY